MEKSYLRIARTILFLLVATPIFAQEGKDGYDKMEVMIPMRDGVQLNTVIFQPKNNSASYPFLFLRTPYGVSDMGNPLRNDYVKDMADDGYIFVYQDIRGRYKSEGKFEMQRFTRNKKDPKAIDESTDTYDTY